VLDGGERSASVVDGCRISRHALDTSLNGPRICLDAAAKTEYANFPGN